MDEYSGSQDETKPAELVQPLPEPHHSSCSASKGEERSLVSLVVHLSSGWEVMTASALIVVCEGPFHVFEECPYMEVAFVPGNNHIELEFHMR